MDAQKANDLDYRHDVPRYILAGHLMNGILVFL